MSDHETLLAAIAVSGAALVCICGLAMLGYAVARVLFCRDE